MNKPEYILSLWAEQKGYKPYKDFTGEVQYYRDQYGTYPTPEISYPLLHEIIKGLDEEQWSRYKQWLEFTTGAAVLSSLITMDRMTHTATVDQIIDALYSLGEDAGER